MFGQTVTASGDTMSQVRNARFASPKKWVAMDIECEAGCGVLPFRYKQKQYVNALQWCIGLELFLLVRDPWRIFLTTDHPNGAPFTTYPHLIRLLMDRSFRARHAGHAAQGGPRHVDAGLDRARVHARTRSRSSPAPARPASSASTASTAIWGRGGGRRRRSTRTTPTASACSSGRGCC